MQRANSSVQSAPGSAAGGPRQWFWTRLNEMPELHGTDAAAMVFAAQDAAKRQAYQDALGMFERILRWAVVDQSGTLLLARAALEGADVAHYAKQLEMAEAWYALSVDTYDLLDGEEARGELVNALKGHAANTVSMSQAPYLDKRLFVALCRKAYFLFDRVIALVDPDLRSVNPILIGPLLSLGQLAANLQRFDQSMMYFERNIKIRKTIGQSTDATYGHLQKVEDKVKQINSQAETQWLHTQRDAQESLQQEELTQRLKIRIAGLRGMLAIEASDKPTLEQYMESLRQQQLRQQQQQKAQQDAQRGVREVRPMSAESIQRAFYTTGSFSGMSAQQELEAFRRDVDLGKQAVKNKALEDAQDYFLAAAEKASQGLLSVVPAEEHRSALGSLAYVFCMRAQNEHEKGSYKFRRMMANSIQHYKKIIDITEERIAEVQADEAEELSLSATYLQLGVVCVNLDRPETALFFMRKARDVKLRLRRDASNEEKQIQQVEKGVFKRDAELLASASQLAEARKQTIPVDHGVKLQDCVRSLLAGKMLMQQRKCDDAEPLLLQAVVGMEELIRGDATLRLKPDYRQALTALGAAYYFVAQEHGKRTQAFSANSEQALVYYVQVLGLLQEAPGPEDPSNCPILFNVACCYVNLRRYDIAARHFAKCKAIKQRNNMPTDDLDSNLDALEAKLLSQIEDDSLFAAQRSSSSRNANNTSTTPTASTPSSSAATDPTTPSGSAKELPLSLSMAQMSKLARKRVTFLMPGESGDSDGGSDIDSTPSSPMGTEPKSILVLSTDSKLLSTPARRLSGSDAGLEGQTPSAAATPSDTDARPDMLFRIRPISRQHPGVRDLDSLVDNAAKFVTREEVDERLQLFQLYELLDRSKIMFFFHKGTNELRLALQVNLEAAGRAYLSATCRKLWLAAAVSLLEEMDQAFRKKLLADFRKVITLPSISHHDKLTSMQETKARTAVLSAQRMGFFHIIEGSNRERVVLWEQKAFQLFFLKALESKALHVKSSMLIVSLRTMVAARFKFIGDAERIARLDTVTSERQRFADTKRTFAMATLRVTEAYNRRVMKANQAMAYHPINEHGSRLLIERDQRYLFRKDMALPLLDGALALGEYEERRRIAAYADLQFCIYFLLPTHHVREELQRTLLGRLWASELLQQVMAAYRAEEAIARRGVRREIDEQRTDAFFQTTYQLEALSRRSLSRFQEARRISQVRLPLLQEREKIARRVVEADYDRRFDGITVLSLLRNQEIIWHYESRSRRTITVLEDEGMLLMVERFEERIRATYFGAWHRITQRMLITHRKALVVMQETVMRQAGERLFHQHRHEKIMSVMAPATAAAMFGMFATRKVVGVETTLRRMVRQEALSTGVRLALAFCQQETEKVRYDVRFEQMLAWQHMMADFVEKFELVWRRYVENSHTTSLEKVWQLMQRGAVQALTGEEVRVRLDAVAGEESTTRLVSLTHVHERWAVLRDHNLIRAHMVLSMRRSFWTTIRRAADHSLVAVHEAEARRAVVVAWQRDRTLALAMGVQMELLGTAVDGHAAKLRLVEAWHRTHSLETPRETELQELGHAMALAALRAEASVQEREAREAVVAAHQEDMDLLYSDMCFDRVLLDQKVVFTAEAKDRAKLWIAVQLDAVRNVEEPLRRGVVAHALHVTQRQALQAQHAILPMLEAEQRAAADLYQTYALETKAQVLSQQALHAYLSIPYAFVVGMRDLCVSEEEDHHELMRDFRIGLSVTGIELDEKLARRALQLDERERICAYQQACFVEAQGFFTREMDERRSALAEAEARAVIDVEATATLAGLDDWSTALLAQGYLDFVCGQVVIASDAAARVTQADEAAEWHALVCELVEAEGQVALTEAATAVVVDVEGDFRTCIVEDEDATFRALSDRLQSVHQGFALQITELVSRRRILSNEANTAEAILSGGRSGAMGLRFKGLGYREAAARSALTLLGRGGLYTDFLEPTKRLVLLWQQGHGAQRLFVAQERLQRQCRLAHEATAVVALSDSFLVSALRLLAAALVGEHRITAELMTARQHTVVQAQAAFTAIATTFETVGSVILLAYREGGRRTKLTTLEYAQDVEQPLQLAALELLLFGTSHDALLREEQGARWGMRLDHTVDCEALQRPVVAQCLLARLSVTRDEGQGRLEVAAAQHATRAALHGTYAAATAQSAAAEVVRVSHRHTAQVHCWSALQAADAYGHRLVAEHALVFPALAMSEESLHREAIEAEHDLERRLLWAKEVLDDERAGRLRLRGLLRLHQHVVQVCITRMAVLRQEVSGWLALQHSCLVHTAALVRLDVALEETAGRAAAEKLAIFRTFAMFQAQVVMVEFVRRAEAILRVVKIIRVERREFELVKSEFELTLPPPPPMPASALSPRGRPSLNDPKGGGGGAPLGARRSSSTNTMYPTATHPTLKTPLFAQRSRAGSFLLEPLSHAPKAAIAAATAAEEKGSITALIARKKVRKQLAALATADECMIREALTVRPMSASTSRASSLGGGGSAQSLTPSGGGTPRDGAARAASSMKLAPMHAAVVRFHQSDAADVAQRVAVQLFDEGTKHLTTHEKYARHTLAEQAEKERRLIASDMLAAAFSLAAEEEMELAIEALASDIMGAMDSFF